MLILKNVNVINFNPQRVDYGVDILIEDGIIKKIGSNLASNYKAEEIIDFKNKYVTPGLVCSHNHFYSYLSRGIEAKIKQSTDFISILKNLWWRLDRSLTEEILYYSSVIGALESIKAGTTSVIDHNASPSFIKGSLNTLKRGFEKTGLRGILCYEVTNRNGDDDMLLGIEESIEFSQNLKSHSLIESAVGAHAAFTLSDKSLALLADAVSKTRKGLHIHAGEDAYDTSHSHNFYSKDILERLNDFELLNEKSIIAHGVHLTNNDINILNTNDSFLIHNPRSNMNNSVGYMHQLSHVKNVALGTDGIGSNMFEETKFGYFKGSDEKQNLSPDDYLMFLNNGNTILERYFNKKFGKIENGYQADIVVYDYSAPTPITNNNIAAHFIFGFSSRDVDTVFINGKKVYAERKFPFEFSALYSEAQNAAKLLWQRMDALDGNSF